MQSWIRQIFSPLLLVVAGLVLLAPTGHASNGDLVLGLVSAPGSAAATSEQGRALADYLAGQVGQEVSLREFSDEATLHHWVDRFREVDLALFSHDYLQRHARGAFIPLAGLPEPGAPSGVMLVARRGVSPELFTKIRHSLKEAGDHPSGASLLRRFGMADAHPPTPVVPGSAPETAPVPPADEAWKIATRPDHPVAEGVKRRLNGALPVSRQANAMTRQADPAAAGSDRLPSRDQAPAADFLVLDYPRPGSVTGPEPLVRYRSREPAILLLNGKPVTVADDGRLGPLSSGDHRLQLQAGQHAAEVEFTVDATPPQFSVAPPGPPTADDQILLSGYREEGAMLVAELPGTGEEVAVAYPGTKAWSLRLGGLIEGKNRLRLTARDRYGNSASTELVIVRDTQPPEFELLAPVAGVHREAPRLDFRVAGGRVDFLLDGMPLDPESARLADLPDGEHELVAVAVDEAGNRTRREVRFTLDRNQPAFGVDPHDTLLNTSSATLSGDREPGSSLAVELEPEVLGARIEYPAADRWIMEVQRLVEGENRITLRLRDRAGNIAQRTIVLRSDRTAPQLEIFTPQPERLYGPSPRLAWQTDADELTFELDGRELPAEDGATLGPLPDGPHVLTVVARDRAGNSRREQVMFRVDGKPPEIAWRAPQPGVYPTDRLRLDVTVDGGEARLLVDGVDMAPDAEGFLGPLADGDHLLRLVAVDAAGNRSTHQVGISIDTRPPRLDLLPAPRVAAAAEVELSGTREAGLLLAAEVSPPAEIELVYPDDGSWQARLHGLPEGETRFTLSGVDAAGNRSTIEHLVTRDTTPPRLEVVAPAAGGVYSAPPALDFRSDAEHLDFLLDGEPFEPVPGDFRIPAGDGGHLLTVTGRDAAGNRAVVEIPFRIDSLAPRLTLQPAEELTAAKTLALAGEREAGSRLEIVPPPGSRLESLDVSDPVAWSALLTELPEGELEVLARAVDQAGNLTEASAIVKVDRSPPQLQLLSPAAGTSADAEPTLEVNTDGTLEVELDGRPLTIRSGSKLGPLGDGEHRLLLRSRDAAGNLAEVRHAWTIDTTPPQLRLLSPLSGSVQGRAPEIAWTLHDPEASIEVKLDGEPVSIESGARLPQLTDGPHRLELIVSDAAGNRSRAVSEFEVDGRPPVISMTSPVAGVTADPTPQLGFEVDRGRVQVLVDGREVSKVSGDSLEPLAAGEHTISLVASTEVGATSRIDRIIVVDPAPVPDRAELPPVSVLERSGELAIRVEPERIPADYRGEVTIRVTGLSKRGETVFLEQWIDQNGNGVADSGEPVIRLARLVDGVASPNSKVLGDEDGQTDRAMTIRLDFSAVNDRYHEPGRYILLVMGEHGIVEASFEVVP